MAVETTYASLRENLVSILDRVIDDREVVVKRIGSEDVAIISPRASYRASKKLPIFCDPPRTPADCSQPARVRRL